MGRGTFAIIVAVLLAILAGSFVGGRISVQELMTIVALFLVWAVGVSLLRGYLRLRNRMRSTQPGDGE